jgi:two-component system, cell cycle sensor histidine kinase and response regulator CckA
VVLLPLVTASPSASLRPLMPIQGAAAVVTFFACAALLLRHRGERRTLGTTFTGGVFVALGLLWSAYGLLATLRLLSPESHQSLVLLVTRLNSYIDSVLELLLGFGMVVTLLEETRREAEKARAEHLAVVADAESRRAQALRIEALGRLVSGVAHELNNPLASILTFSEQLLTEQPAGELTGPLGTIREQARRARAIVRDLLTFVRRRDEHWEPADIPVLVERTVRALHADRQRLGVTLKVDLEPALPSLLCAPTAIEQVLTNLLDNAMRAAPGGEVRLAARGDDRGVRFTVSDTGGGIPAEHLPRIFEPFFTTRAQGEGTGLGLSVSLGIVEQHRGTLVAKNREIGRGAIFEVWLPLTAPTRTLVAGAPAHHPARLEGPPGRVLIIDDEAPFRASVRRVFERCGWSVREADDGAVALEVLSLTSSDTRFDLILCDLKMPGVSGMEVYRSVRNSRPELLPRLVFASGDTASVETAAFLESTTCPVLEKPFELSELATVVARIRSGSTTT